MNVYVREGDCGQTGNRRPLKRGASAGARGKRISGHASGLRCALASAGTGPRCRTRASRWARAPDARPRGAVLFAASGWLSYFQMNGNMRVEPAVLRDRCQLSWAAMASGLWAATEQASCKVPRTLLSLSASSPLAASCCLWPRCAGGGGGLWIAPTCVVSAVSLWLSCHAAFRASPEGARGRLSRGQQLCTATVAFPPPRPVRKQ